MVWEINNIPGECYVVQGMPTPKVYESWRVVKQDGKTYKVLYSCNDLNTNHWSQRYSEENFETVDQAVTAIWKEVPMKDAVYGIPKEQFAQLKKRHFPDYISCAIADHVFNGKVCKVGEWCGFASVLTGDYSKGTSLIFEHIHFEII